MAGQATCSVESSSLFRRLMRRKCRVSKSEGEEGSHLKRALSTFDLTLLGVGSTIGIGMYVLSGVIAKTAAGPAVVISFAIAACASVLSGLCYAEFAARVPSAGSAYAYSYAVIGELVAFVVGWNLLIEYAIGVASVGRAYSVVVDTIVGRKMIAVFKDCCSMNVSFLASYFDFFGFFIVELVAILLTLGVKASAKFNNTFTVLNVSVILFVLFVGSTLANTKNWSLKKEQIMEENPELDEKSVGEGGFAPFGFEGIMRGAASCFYAYVGFDSIAASAEEAKTPQKSIPIAIISSLLFVFLAYFATATVITMMVPYYGQDSEAPLSEGFAIVEFPPGKWIVTIGALAGHSSSLISAIYPMPRVLYSMASDGVIPTFLSKIHPKYKTPMIATLFSGTLAGFVSGMFNLSELIDMMSIGTLNAYTLVAICVLCLKYRRGTDLNDQQNDEDRKLNPVSCWGQIFNCSKLTKPNRASSKYSDSAILLYGVVTILFCITAVHGHEEIVNLNPFVISLLSILGATMGFILLSLSFQPVDDTILHFKVPLVPWLPGVSVLINIYLMMKLTWLTWCRFGIWMILGFIIYGTCLCNGTTNKSYQEYQNNEAMVMARNRNKTLEAGDKEVEISSETEITAAASTIST